MELGRTIGSTWEWEWKNAKYLNTVEMIRRTAGLAQECSVKNRGFIALCRPSGPISAGRKPLIAAVGRGERAKNQLKMALRAVHFNARLHDSAI